MLIFFVHYQVPDLILESLRVPCIGAATSDVLRSGAPAPDEEPVVWAEGRGAAFPQADGGVDRGGGARDRA